MTIPTLGVSSDLEHLGVQPDGTLSPPTEFGRAGWFAGGVEPGQPGPAVIAGHVDSRSGPAVFHALGDLAPGDGIEVTRGRRLDGHVPGDAGGRAPQVRVPHAGGLRPRGGTRAASDHLLGPVRRRHRPLRRQPRRLRHAGLTDALAAAIAGEIDRRVDYRPVATDGPARAGALVADLV